MAVPNYQSLMLPVLKALADGRELSISEVRARVAASVGLTVDDMREMLPSGRQSLFVNRVAWEVAYLGHSGLAENVRRANSNH